MRRTAVRQQPVVQNQEQNRIEALGPAEKIIQTLMQHADHLYHGRPGIFVKNSTSVIGGEWFPVTHKQEGEQKVVYRQDKVGKGTRLVRLGVLGTDGKVKDGRTLVGEYRSAGIFPEVAEYLYKQIAAVWKMDNEFAARWASWSFVQQHRDLKVLLSAFMLVQNRRGDPVVDTSNGTKKVLFNDDDYREVGEAMCLLLDKNGNSFNPKQILRVVEVLNLPKIVEINRELGFSRSARSVPLGRLPKVLNKWLTYRERNKPLFEGLLKAGFRQSVMDIARYAGYKPASEEFFQALRWKQKQAKDGRRSLAIGKGVKEAETWEGLSEETICQRIVTYKMSAKRVMGMLPKSVGLTQAVMMALLESGGVSDRDLIILTPTLEDLGLLQVPEVKVRWEKALKAAEDQRAVNIATKVRKQETVEKLQEAADGAMKKAVEETMRGMRVYVVVDKSGSMTDAIERSKKYLSQFLQGFPLDKLHVSIFNTVGTVLKIKHASAAGVEQAFRGHAANGGTMYEQGVLALREFQPAADEDTIMIFVGDQLDHRPDFADKVRESGLRPSAFGLLEVTSLMGSGHAVEATANVLGIPCFRIDESTFSDPYAVSRTIRNLIASTPVGQGMTKTGIKRQSLVEEILKTELLKKPAWA